MPVRVLDLLGIGLTGAAGVLMTLYRRLRRRMPVRLPVPLVFRVGNWSPPVPFILADGIDLDCPRLLGPDQISCSETESNLRLEWELTKQREAIVEAYSRGARQILTLAWPTWSASAMTPGRTSDFITSISTTLVCALRCWSMATGCRPARSRYATRCRSATAIGRWRKLSTAPRRISSAAG